MGFVVALFVLLVMGALVFIMSPVLVRAQERFRREIGERERLKQEKNVALLLIKDLEFDYRTGKLQEGDYQASLADAQRRAMTVLHELDVLDKPNHAAS